jgi:hypothetical protein
MSSRERIGSSGTRVLSSVILVLGLVIIARTAAAGVERLAGDGRLVAVITHLPGVADRLGAAIHVRKDAEGTSRVVEPATPDRGPAPPLGAPVMVAP